MLHDQITIKRALISVSDKSGVVELGRQLITAGVEIISTGGTYRHLLEAGVSAIELKDFTGEEEILGGRVKTLGRPIMGGILFHRQRDSAEALRHKLKAIDLVVCNFYPFEELKKDANDQELAEMIDIGGPTMTRASAKNFSHVAILSTPTQYTQLHTEQGNNIYSTYQQRRTWAQAAFARCQEYDNAIASRLLGASVQSQLRYGENPHQAAWLECDGQQQECTGVQVLQGKEMSFNNYLDLAAAIRSNEYLYRQEEFSRAAIVSIVKHQNPCALVAGENMQACLVRAWKADEVSAFGSVICINGKVDAAMAAFIQERFVEIVAAHSFADDAREILSKKKNMRLVTYDPAVFCRGQEVRQLTERSRLVQERDMQLSREWQWMTQPKYTVAKGDNKIMMFAEHVGRCLKSNAIAIVAREGNMLVTVGLGMGNPNRLLSMKTALEQAQLGNYFKPQDCWLYSDAFFPFADGVELAHQYKIKRVLQPGGSINDQKVIEVCNTLGISMAFSNVRHFLH
jgi:phosphoribosylaminoimidazolecarboxamide formyltransferase/IMP cyclohydrolase